MSINPQQPIVPIIATIVAPILSDENAKKAGIINEIVRLNNLAVNCMKKCRKTSMEASTHLFCALNLSASPLMETCTDLQHFDTNFISEVMQSSEENPNNQLYLAPFYDIQNYDEGMDAFPEPIHLPNTSTAPHHSIIATVFYNLGQLYKQQHEDVTSLCFFKLAYKQCKFNGNTSSMNEIFILHNIGYIHYRNKSFDLAFEAFAMAFHVCREILDFQHLVVASALNCIGVTILHTTKTKREKALNFFLQSLSIRKHILTEENSDVATILNNIGRVYYDSGDFDKAREAYDEALGMRKRTLGPGYIDVAVSAFNVGQTCQRLGQLDEAMRQYRFFFRVASKVLGRNHGDIAIVLKHIGEVYHQKKEHEKARKYYRDALRIIRKASGDFNQEAASILNMLGNSHYESKDYDRAIEIYEKGLILERDMLERDHCNMVVTLSNIAKAYMKKGDYFSCLNKYTEVYSIQCVSSDIDCLELAETLSMIGQLSSHVGEYGQAQNAFLEVIRIRREALGNHMDLALALNYLGLIYFKQGSLNLAKSNFEESLHIRRSCGSEDNHDIPILLYNIASIYLHQGDNDMALKLYKETLAAERSMLGEHHSEVATTLELIRRVYDQCGLLEDAIKYYTEALEVHQRIGNDSSVPIANGNGDDARKHKLSVARMLGMLGNVYLCKADIDKMMEVIIKAYRIYESIDAPFCDLELGGFDMYELSILYPECAPVA